MSFLQKAASTTGTPSSMNVLVHGHAGAGKTTFAFSRPNVIGIPVEQGLGVLTADMFPAPRTFAEVMEMLRELVTGEHDYTGVVIDAVDGLIPLIEKDVCDEHGKKSIADFGFGKGNVYADGKWQELLRGCEYLSKSKGITPILISHSSAVHYEDPVSGTYVRWEPSLGKRVVPLVCAWADVVGFLDREKHSVDKGSEGRTVRTAMSTGARRMTLDDTGAAIAKNRYGLQAEVQIPPTGGWDTVQGLINDAFKSAAKPAKNKGKK